MSDERFDRLELEIANVRNRMQPDVARLREQTRPDAIKEKVRQALRERLRALGESLKAQLERQKEETVLAAGRQVELLQEAREKGDASKVQEAVKSDPRPMIVLAVALAVVLFVLRRLGRAL
ncbi:hypothetical protein E0L93_01675 [Rubrobacter taiwanensis]|jgi:thioredoxin-like negative regulator of GroEL|uniref:DUF3618 domain-containing protein n=1 Tax=Rubrobacter taiwanensis TaxID=185139 RepID=A0A4R1BT36_9ACTN|nr:hypothetical protein [Rubrobacter taiwanensis]TCJ20557.1 hypothetical protein E0L93_01675 [Rubrobacter taiwanensis]